MTLSLERHRSERDRQAIEDGLHAFNVDATGIRGGALLTLALKDGHARLRGGLLGHTWGGCLTVTHLWIHPRFRHRGHGSRLLAAAESHARARRCRASVLSTHSFQARAFYERFGYRVVAELRDYPYGHGQIRHAQDPADAPRKTPTAPGLTLQNEPALADGLKYFHPDLFRAAFVTPNYVRKITPR